MSDSGQDKPRIVEPLSFIDEENVDIGDQPFDYRAGSSVDRRGLMLPTYVRQVLQMTEGECDE